MGLPLKAEFGITASELIVPPIRFDKLNVDVCVFAAIFAGESVVGFGCFIFHGIYLLMVEVSYSTHSKERPRNGRIVSCSFRHLARSGF